MGVIRALQRNCSYSCESKQHGAQTLYSYLTPSGDCGAYQHLQSSIRVGNPHLFRTALALLLVVLVYLAPPSFTDHLLYVHSGFAIEVSQAQCQLQPIPRYPRCHSTLVAGWDQVYANGKSSKLHVIFNIH